MKRSMLIAGLATAVALAASTLTADAGVYNRTNAGATAHRSGVELVHYRDHGRRHLHRPHFRPFWPWLRHRHHHWH